MTIIQWILIVNLLVGVLMGWALHWAVTRGDDTDPAPRPPTPRLSITLLTRYAPVIPDDRKRLARVRVGGDATFDPAIFSVDPDEIPERLR